MPKMPPKKKRKQKTKAKDRANHTLTRKSDATVERFKGMKQAMADQLPRLFCGWELSHKAHHDWDVVYWIHTSYFQKYESTLNTDHNSTYGTFNALTYLC